MALPLLRFPHLIVINVLQCLGFVERFFVTRVSKRMKTFVKEFLKVRNYTLQFCCDENSVVTFLNPDNEELASIFLRTGAGRHHFRQRIGGLNNVKYVNLKHDNPDLLNLQLECDDYVVGTMELFKDLFDVFATPVSRMIIDLTKIETSYQQLVISLSQPGTIIPSVRVYGEDCDFEAYLWMLNRGATQCLWITARPRQLLNIDPFVLRAKMVVIGNSSWVRLQHLQVMEGTHIVIQQSTFTMEEINACLKGIKTGSHPNLEGLDFTFRRVLDMAAILTDLDVTEDEEGYWNFKMDNGKTCIFKEIFSIQNGVPEMILKITIQS